MKIYKKILDKSKSIDQQFENIPNWKLGAISITFSVPSNHPRFKSINKYSFSSFKIENLYKTEFLNSRQNNVFIIDNSLKELSFIKEFIKNNKIKPIILEALENKVKTKVYLDELIQRNSLNILENITIVVIGGGLLLNISAYIAEKLNANIIQFPSTVLSMSDSAGGKVRVNLLTKEKAYKHFYKSYYEPNAMFLDDRFLNYLPEQQIKIGLVEIIKHGLFQSPKLYDFLAHSGKELLYDKDKLKKAILWTLKLKNICLEIDPEENDYGSGKILRGGHNFSDRIEEDLRFNVPHGIAVAVGIIKQLDMEKEKMLLFKAKKIFDLLDIPFTFEKIITDEMSSSNKCVNI